MNKIDELTVEAYAKVQSHPDHWLLPMYRRVLYKALDPSESIPLRLRVRPWLELHTAQYVLPLWEPIRQDPLQVWDEYFDAPSHMVALLNDLLHGKGRSRSMVKFAEHWAEVSGLTGELDSSEYYHAWCVYRAALKALLFGLGRDEFSKANFFTEITTQIDNVYGDCANWAAIAFAGGIWRPELPIQIELGRVYGLWDRELEEVRVRRRQFWEWWLLKAIPAAYNEAHRQRE